MQEEKAQEAMAGSNTAAYPSYETRPWRLKWGGESTISTQLLHILFYLNFLLSRLNERV